MGKQIPEWLVQLTWFVAGIFATGALWYFISVDSTVSAVAAALAAFVFCALAVYLHRTRDNVLAAGTESEARSKRMHSPIVLTVGEERITFDELHRSTDFDVIKVNTDDHITGVMSEHAWLRYRYPDAHMEMQALSSLDGLKQVEVDDRDGDEVSFDVIDIRFPDNRRKKVYFDISSFFDGMDLNKLDPESRAAKKLNELYG